MSEMEPFGLLALDRQITSQLEMPVEPQAVQNAPHLWRPSPPPKEDWEAEAGEQKWEYEGIVNEEVDVYGTTRCACIVPSQGYYGDERTRFAIVQLRGKLGTVSQLRITLLNLAPFQVKWRNWHRKDAAKTNTTWHEGLPDMEDVQKKWDHKRTQERVALAEESLEMSIGVQPDQQWHEDATIEAQAAYEQKLAERRRKGMRVYSHWDEVLSIAEYSESESDPE